MLIRTTTKLICLQQVIHTNKRHVQLDVQDSASNGNSKMDLKIIGICSRDPYDESTA
jgi:hypothetical protein